MRHCVVSVDPVSLLVLEIQDSSNESLILFGESSKKFIGRPLAFWISYPEREDLARLLSVTLRSRETRRFRANTRPVEGSSVVVELSVSAAVKSRNQSVLEISVSILSPVTQTGTQKLTA